MAFQVGVRKTILRRGVMFRFHSPADLVSSRLDDDTLSNLFSILLSSFYFGM
jgi:hypothetical protein